MAVCYIWLCNSVQLYLWLLTMSRLHLTTQRTRDLSLWWGTVVLHKPGAERLFMPKAGAVLLEGKKTRMLSLIKHIFFLPLLQLPLYLSLWNVNAELSHCVLPKRPSCLFTHIMFSCIALLSFITSHPGLSSQCWGEKYQLFGLVYLSRLLDLSYFNGKPVLSQ